MKLHEADGGRILHGGSLGISAGVHALILGAAVAGALLAPRPVEDPVPAPGLVTYEVSEAPALAEDWSDPPREAPPSASAAPEAPRLDEIEPETERAIEREDLVSPVPPPARGPSGPAEDLADRVARRPRPAAPVKGPEVATESRDTAPSPTRAAAGAEPSAPSETALVRARPVPTACPEPPYPSVALRRGWTGRVVVEIDVAADGGVLGARVVTGSGHPVLDEAALEAVRTWRFFPARRAGRPEASTLRQVVRFRLTDPR